MIEEWVVETMFTKENCDQVRERLEELTRYAVTAGVRKSIEYSERHPLRVIAGIAGAGALLGIILRSRSKQLAHDNLQ